MYILLLLLIHKGNPTVTSLEFNNQTACLKALNTVLDFENKNTTIKARCVKNDQNSYGNFRYFVVYKNDVKSDRLANLWIMRFIYTDILHVRVDGFRKNEQGG